MVFPELNELTWLPAKIYEKARCGLYHHGLTKQGIILQGEGLPPLTILCDENVLINPHTLATKLKKHFETYINELSKDANFKSNFERRFNYDRGI